MVSLNFNASTVAPTAPLEPVPSGNYIAMITKSEEKPNAKGTGTYVELEETILHPEEFKGRKVFDRLNLKNPNDTAVAIAYGTLSALCHVTGQIQCNDSSELHGKPFMVVVAKVERSDQPGSGVMTNVVKGYKTTDGKDPGKSGQVATQAAVPVWGAQQQAAPVTQQQPVQQAAPVAAVAQPAPAQQQAVAPVAAASPPPWQQPAATQAAPVAGATPPWANPPAS